MRAGGGLAWARQQGARRGRAGSGGGARVMVGRNAGVMRYGATVVVFDRVVDAEALRYGGVLVGARRGRGVDGGC